MQPAIGDADLDQPGQIFGSFVQAAVQSLPRIEGALDRDTPETFAEVLARAEVVHAAAARGAFGLCSIGQRAHLVDNPVAMRATADRAGSTELARENRTVTEAAI